MFFYFILWRGREVLLGANDKSISTNKQWLFSLSSSLGLNTHTTPAAAVFVQPDKQQWPTKNAYKNRCSLVYTFCCSASHAGLAGIINNSSMQPATQPMNYGESVREEGERENGCTIGALFSLWTFTHFYEEKKMINDGRVMCRTTMPLRWMNEGLLPHVYVYIYTTTIMTWGWNQKKEEKSWE